MTTPTNYFTTYSIINSGTSTNKDSEGNTIKYMMIQIQLQSPVANFTGESIIGQVRSYSFDFLDSNGVSIYSEVDDPNKIKLQTLSYVDAVTIDNSTVWNTIDKPYTTDATNYLVVPYDYTNYGKRVYQFVFDITGKDQYLTYWKTNPLVVYANVHDSNGILANTSGSAFQSFDVPQVTFAFEVVDCSTILQNLSEMLVLYNQDPTVYDPTGTGEFTSLDDGDLAFLQDLIIKNGSAETCTWSPIVLDNPTVPPTVQTDVDSTLAILGKLICFLESKISIYKTQVGTISGSSVCYKFLPCIFKNLVQLRSMYKYASTKYTNLLEIYEALSTKYTDLANLILVSNAKGKAMIANATNWIKQNVDSNFDINTSLNGINPCFDKNIAYNNYTSSLTQYGSSWTKILTKSEAGLL